MNNHRLPFVAGVGRTNEEPSKIYIRGMCAAKMGISFNPNVVFGESRSKSCCCGLFTDNNPLAIIPILYVESHLIATGWVAIILFRLPM